MQFQRLTPEEMDQESERATQALISVQSEEVKVMARWWQSHYLNVGYRALGRLFLDSAAGANNRPATEPNEDIRAAHEDLKAIARSTPKPIAAVLAWYREWYLKAGHKRLGRILCDRGKPFSTRPGGRRAASPAEETPHERISVVDVTCNVRYQFKAVPLDTPALFCVQPSAGVTLIAVNTNHPAGEAAFDALSSAAEGKFNADDSAPGIPSLFVLAVESWARLESETPHGKRQDTVKKVREDWGRTLRDMFLSQSATTGG